MPLEGYFGSSTRTSWRKKLERIYEDNCICYIIVVVSLRFEKKNTFHEKKLFISFSVKSHFFFSNRKYIILNRRWTAFTIIIIHRRRIPRRRHIFFNNKYFFFVSSSFFWTVKPSVTFWKKFFWGNCFVYPFSVCLRKRHYISQKSIWNLFSYWLFNHNWKILLKLSF